MQGPWVLLVGKLRSHMRHKKLPHKKLPQNNRVFSYYWVIRVLYIFCMQASHILTVNNFPQSGLSFHFLKNVFWIAQFFNFEEVQFISSFIYNFFCFMSKKSLPTGLLRFSYILRFSCRYFTSPDLVFGLWPIFE